MNYKNLLYEIQNANQLGPAATTIPLTENTQLYTVDLNTRTIKAPTFLSVESEHKAQTIYFVVDRYFNEMDLMQTKCIIQYENDQNESFIYPVPFCDCISMQNKIIIPWKISSSATKNAGTIKYIIRFYIVDVNWDENQIPITDTLYFKYSLATLPAQSRILNSFSLDQLTHDAEEYQINIEDKYFELLNNVNDIADAATLYWTDV